MAVIDAVTAVKMAVSVGLVSGVAVAVAADIATASVLVCIKIDFICISLLQ